MRAGISSVSVSYTHLDVYKRQVIDSERFIKDMKESFQHKFAHKENLIEGNMKALTKAMEEVKVG